MELKTAIKAITDKLDREAENILSGLRTTPSDHKTYARRVAELVVVVDFLRGVLPIDQFDFDRYTYQRFMTDPIESLELSARLTNRLKRAGIVCVCQICDLGRDGLVGLGFGRDSINQLMDSITEHGGGGFLFRRGHQGVVLGAIGL